MNRRLSLLAVLGASLACATAPRFTSEREQEEIADRLATLERRSADATREIAALEKRLSTLETSRGGAVAPAAPAAAPIAVTAPAPARTHAEVPGRVEESDLDEPAVGVAPASPESADYEEGLRLLRTGSYAAAETKLRRLADEHPDSDLADNAWFWIGESRLARGDDAGALDAFRTTLERYPEGNKVPDAMLKLGQTLLVGGDRASAREVWSELVRRFPASTAADSARARLAEP